MVAPGSPTPQALDEFNSSRSGDGHGQNLWRDILEELVERANPAYIAAGRPPLRQQSIPQGAATSVWAGAVGSADEVGGRYCEDCQVADVAVAAADPTIPWGARAYALDPEHAKALWAKSQEMVSEQF